MQSVRNYRVKLLCVRLYRLTLKQRCSKGATEFVLADVHNNHDCASVYLEINKYNFI